MALSLHNMLVKRGFLDEDIDLFAQLGSLMGNSFFSHGVPSKNFGKAPSAFISQGFDQNVQKGQSQRENIGRAKTINLHELFNPDFNRYFKAKSSLMMYYDAGWKPENIPDKDIRMAPMLYFLRLKETGKVVDSSTGETRLKETELVQRDKARGVTDSTLLKSASVIMPTKTSQRHPRWRIHAQLH